MAGIEIKIEKELRACMCTDCGKSFMTSLEHLTLCQKCQRKHNVDLELARIASQVLDKMNKSGKAWAEEVDEKIEKYLRHAKLLRKWNMILAIIIMTVAVWNLIFTYWIAD